MKKGIREIARGNRRPLEEVKVDHVTRGRHEGGSLASP